MMLLLISGMLFWGFFNICYIYKECDIHKNLICNISQSTSAPFNPMTEKLFHPWGSSKLNPMAKVFISKEVHNIKQNFGRNIFAPPFYPRQFSYDISVNNDRMEDVGLETTISTANRKSIRRISVFILTYLEGKKLEKSYNRNPKY